MTHGMLELDMQIIKQVHGFMVTGLDSEKTFDEEIEASVSEKLPEPEEAIQNNEKDVDPYAGPQSWLIEWFGPYFSENIPKERCRGLYLIYVGSYPVFISSSANVLAALTRHLMFSGRQVIPIDLLGREIVHYSTHYRQPINIKTGVIYDDEQLIEPSKYIQCYRRAAAAIAYCHRTPCNKYASSSYEYESLTIMNKGRFFPLKSTIYAEKNS